MRLRREASIFVAIALALGAGAPACSSDVPAPDGSLLYSPCAEGTRVGGFALWVTTRWADAGTTDFNGVVWDHQDGPDSWRPVVSEGACTLRERDPGIPCSPSCRIDDACYAGTCGPMRIAHSVGTVKLTGLRSGRSVFEPITGGTINYASGADDLPYPPAPPGAALSLHTSGGDYTPFTLAGRGVAPLPPRPSALAVARDQPLTIEWSVPSLPAGTQLVASIRLGGADNTGAGGIPDAGNIVCYFPDTGTGTVPASLLNRLIDQGVGAAPMLNMWRMTVSSTQLTHGCVDFSVVTPSSQVLAVSP